MRLRTSAALAAGKAARLASRLRGGGSALPGLVTERIDPAVLRHTLGSLPRGVVVVSGAEALEGVQQAVVHVALPEDEVFATDEADPTASVLLDLAPGTLDVERRVLAENGNMSAPTVLFVLAAVLRNDPPPKLMAMALGPGFTLSVLPIAVG